jgi:hypothetical protein
MSEIGIYQVDAVWVPAQVSAEPRPVSFLIFRGIGEKERAAVVLRAEEKKQKHDPLPLGALLIKLPISRIQEYASTNALRRKIQSTLDKFKQDLEGLMRQEGASRARIYPDETAVARGVAITGFFMRRESTVRHQAGRTRVHVMTFGAQPPPEAEMALPSDLSKHLQGSIQTLQTVREKGKDVTELTVISTALYKSLLSLRQAQVEAERSAKATYREIATWIAWMSQDIQGVLETIRGGWLVDAQGLNPGIVEGIAFSLKEPGAVPSEGDPIAAVFLWEVDEKFVHVQGTKEHLVLRWPREEGEENQAQEEQE